MHVAKSRHVPIACPLFSMPAPCSLPLASHPCCPSRKAFHQHATGQTRPFHPPCHPNPTNVRPRVAVALPTALHYSLPCALPLPTIPICPPETGPMPSPHPINPSPPQPLPPHPCLHAPVCLPPLFLHYRPCFLIPCPAPMRLLATHLPCLVLCLPASHAVPIPPLQMSANLFLRPLSCPFCSPFLVSDDQHDPIACVTETPPVVE